MEGLKETSSIIRDNKYQSINESKLYFSIKRLIDVIGALIGMFLFFPLFIVIAITMKIQDKKGTIFFRQKRVGKHGEIFYIYKFRSMVSNAEQKLKENKELYEKYLKNNYKLEAHEDPRITKLGNFLRKTSLDELPQLINVLKGNMTLVGPRPVVEEELMEYGENVNKFLSVKPGVTGYWQVSGRSNVGYPERVDLELYYVYNQSLLFDLRIIILTIWMVLIRRGAY